MDPSWLGRAHGGRGHRTAAGGVIAALLLALAGAACSSSATTPSASASETAALSPSASTTESAAATDTLAPSPTKAPTLIPTPKPTPKPTPTHPAAPGMVSSTTTFGVQSVWASATLTVAPDDVLIFTATGTYRGGTGQPNVNPITINCGIPPFNYTGFPAPHVERFAVMGKVGSTGEPFCIGGGRAVKVETSGQLFVGVNTNDPAGALGTVTVVAKRYRWAGQIPETTVDVTGWDVQSSWVQTIPWPEKGDYLIFYAIGRYRGAMGQPNVTPESVGCAGGPFANAGFPAPQLKKYAVVGRLGSHTPFCIGGGRTMIADFSDVLDVTMNTNDHAGALGWVEVSTVQYHWP